MRFPCDSNRKYNPKGEYREKTELLAVKYNKQGHFYLGVGIVDRGNGPEGKRIELFDYTSKNIISMKDTEKLIDSTTAKVKHLPRDHKKWCISNRADGVYYSNDPLTVIEDVSNKKAVLLIEAGIKSISELAKIKGDVIENQQRFRASARLVSPPSSSTQRVKRWLRGRYQLSIYWATRIL